MSMIEVRANLSFDQYRLGKYYQVDGNDPRIQNQVYAGYFKVVNVLGEDLADDPVGPISASDLDPGTPGPKKRAPKKKVSDEDHHLRREGEDLRDAGDDAPRSQDG